MAINLTGSVTSGERAIVVASSIAGIVALIVLEHMVGPDLPLGGFYLLPLAVAAAFLPRWATFAVAIATAIVREVYGPNPWDAQSLGRLAVSLVAFAGGALFAGELVRNRRMVVALLDRTRQEMETRTNAEREARALVEGSPVGVLTIDSAGKIAMANTAACRLLGFEKDSPEGDPVEKYFPILARLLHSKQAATLTRTMMEASGTRRNGETFFSQAWISSYNSSSGMRLTVVLSDVTEQIRDREESGLRQLMSSSRIVAGAVSHELRNLAAAAAVLHLNTAKTVNLSGNPDYQALGTVIDSIVELSSTELADAGGQVLEGVDIADLLREVRTITAPSLEEAGIASEWEIGEELPNVRVNRTGLLQVFLNMIKNSTAALKSWPSANIRVTAYPMAELAVVRISDNGPGISSTERLFQPFQPGASSTGLGLFVSRAIVRTFGGELHHTQRPGECCFVIELPGMGAKD
jgi:two-component system sensor kinase FixL